MRRCVAGRRLPTGVAGPCNSNMSRGFLASGRHRPRSGLRRTCTSVCRRFISQDNNDEWENVPLKPWRKPLDRNRVVSPRGIIHLVVERCKGCELCATYCPRNVLEMSATFNSKGYHPPQARDAERCVACGLCEILCPEFAIFVTEVPDGQ